MIQKPKTAPRVIKIPPKNGEGIDWIFVDTYILHPFNMNIGNPTTWALCFQCFFACSQGFKRLEVLILPSSYFGAGSRPTTNTQAPTLYPLEV